MSAAQYELEHSLTMGPRRNANTVDVTNEDFICVLLHAQQPTYTCSAFAWIMNMIKKIQMRPVLLNITANIPHLL